MRTAPFDLVLALRLLAPAATLVELADELGVVPSQVHTALARLARAGLLKPGSRATNARALTEFALYGVRYAFPATKGSLASGVPTAYSASPLASEVDAIDVVVLPAAVPDAIQGFAITPLYRGAAGLAARAPQLFEMVALVDAIRLGDPRIRLAARTRLEQRINAAASLAGATPPSTAAVAPRSANGGNIP
jgi:ABC-type sulfate transport system permease component